MSLPSSLPSAAVWRDSEVVYAPHWLLSDGTTVIVNSAEGIFPKPIVEPISIAIYHADVYKTSYTDATFKNELNATNSGSWRGWDAGQAWISRIHAEDEEANGISAVKVHYIIRCNEFGWNHHIPQMGFFYKSGESKEVFGEGIGLLDGTGAELPFGTAAVDSDIQVKRQISFAGIGF